MQPNSMRVSVIWSVIGLGLMLLAAALLLLQLGSWWILVGGTGAGTLGAGLVNVQRARSRAQESSDKR